MSDRPAATAPFVYEVNDSGAKSIPAGISTDVLKAATEEMVLVQFGVALRNLRCGDVTEISCAELPVLDLSSKFRGVGGL